MTRPSVSNLAERIYQLLEPLHVQDEKNGYGLLVICESISKQFQQAYRWTGEEQGWYSWQELFGNIGDAGSSNNKFVGQLLGVNPERNTQGVLHEILLNKMVHAKGSIGLLNLIIEYFHGDNNFIILERLDDSLNDEPYNLYIRSFTPFDPSVIDRINLWKPAGLVLHIGSFSDLYYIDFITDSNYPFVAGAGGGSDVLLDSIDTYQDFYDYFGTYQGVEDL